MLKDIPVVATVKYLLFIFQTTPLECKGNVDMEATINEGKTIKRKRGRPRKTGEPGISRSKARKKIYENVNIKKEESKLQQAFTINLLKLINCRPCLPIFPIF